MVISGACLKLGFFGCLWCSVDLQMLWLGIVVDPLRVLWRSEGPRVYRGIVVGGVDWLMSRSLGLWLT